MGSGRAAPCLGLRQLSDQFICGQPKTFSARTRRCRCTDRICSDVSDSANRADVANVNGTAELKPETSCGKALVLPLSTGMPNTTVRDLPPGLVHDKEAWVLRDRGERSAGASETRRGARCHRGAR